MLGKTLNITTISIFEAIRNRPQMYFTSVEDLFGICQDNAKQQSNITNIEVILEPQHTKLAFDNYIYPKHRTDPISNALDDLTKIYIGSQNNANRQPGCLYGIGAVLNAISDSLVLKIFDGISIHEISFINQRLEYQKPLEFTGQTRFSIECKIISGFKILA
jgi:DNA gyrase/topoisomerase IV subunit B